MLAIINKTLGVILLLGFMPFKLYGQTVTVHVTDTTHTQDSIRALIRPGEQILNSRQQVQDNLKTKLDPSSYQDSLRSLAGAWPVTKVYSEKYIKKLSDSIRATTGVTIPENLSDKMQVSKEDLLNIINDKFPHWPESESQITEDAIPRSIGDIPSAVPELSAIPDVTGLRLPSEDLLELSPLPGNLVKTKYIEKIDSLRKINLKDEKLRLQEEKTSAQSKLAIIKETPNFWQKSYFEGVLGVWSGRKFTIYQASPAFGYHFTDYFSLGIGPTLQLQSSDKRLYTYAGIRTFSKIEFLKRQVYVQIEDSMNPYDPKNEEIRLDTHNIFVGGGFLLSLKTAFTLNFSVLYKVNDNDLSVSDISPIVFRVGISSIKIEK